MIHPDSGRRIFNRENLFCICQIKFVSLLTIIFSVLIFVPAKSQTLEWERTFGSAGFDAGWEIVVDANGNVYTAGTFSLTVDFDPGAGITNLTAVGNRDIFIQKMDANGNFIWAVSMGGTGQDTVLDLVLDATGNVYTTGTFFNTVDFDPGPGTVSHTSAGLTDIFIQKLSPTGDLVWVHSFGNTGVDAGRALTIDSDDNLQITGGFNGTIDFDPGVGVSELTVTNDMFILTLNLAGDFVQVRELSGPSTFRSTAIDSDDVGNIYITGNFNGNADFDPDPGSVHIVIATNDIFILKLDNQHTFIWVSTLNLNVTNDIAVDNLGNIYTTGTFTNTIDFDPGAAVFSLVSNGNSDLYILKLDGSGNFDWAISSGGVSVEFSFQIVIDADGDIYTTGKASTNHDFDPGPGETIIGANTSYVQKLDAFSNFLWAEGLGPGIGASVFVDPSKNVYITSAPNDIAVYKIDQSPNLAPVVANAIPNQAATEDIAYAFQFSSTAFSDPDADILTYSAVLSDGSALPDWLTFAPATRTFSGTPLNQDVGSITVRVTADDGNGASVFDDFSLEVINVNDAPLVDNIIPNQNAIEDQAFSFAFALNTFSDPDNDVLSYTANEEGNTSLPSWLSFDGSTRVFSGTPTNEFVGTTVIYVTADDGNGETVLTSFELTVTNTNNAPIVANPIPDQSATEDQAYNFQFANTTFSDPDADILTYSATLSDGSSLPDWLTFAPATRTFSGTPLNQDVGSITIRVTADDGNGETVLTSFELTVTNTNDAPVVANSIADQVINEGELFSFQFPENTFDDVDAGDMLTYSAAGLPVWLGFDDATRTFSGTPGNTDIGESTITLTATDDNASIISDVFVITVSSVTGLTKYANTIKIYPNPVNTYLTIETEKSLKRALIYSINGKIVKVAKVINNQIDLSELEEGVYFLLATLRNGDTFRLKFLKNR